MDYCRDSHACSESEYESAATPDPNVVGTHFVMHSLLGILGDYGHLTQLLVCNKYNAQIYSGRSAYASFSI